MCGINGWFGSQRGPVDRMNEATRHRGPDRSNTFVGSTVTLGTNRLAIVGLGENGDQPMQTPDGAFALSFNGEIYNYQELRAELQSNGIVFKGNSDTEVVLHGLASAGPTFLDRLRGMWGLAFWNEREGTLLLSRDPFGIKPLYLYSDGSCVAFSSEVRGLLALPEVDRTLDVEAVGDLLLLGYILAPRTILAHARALLPGECVILERDGRERSRTIRSLPANTKNSAEPSDAELKEVLLDSVRKHLIAEVPVGLFFSGGIDSTAIALLLKELGVQLQGYHLEIESREDSGYMRQIAAAAGIPVTMRTLTKQDAQYTFEKLGALLDQPLGDTSFIPTYLIAERAAEDVKVVLSGEGGDEFFAGYNRHRRLGTRSLSSNLSPSVLGSLAQHSSNPKVVEAVRSLLRRTARDPFSLYSAEVAIGYGKIPSRPIEQLMRERLQGREHPDGTLAIDRLVYLPDDLLMKIDTATMAHSIEGRVPLADKDVFAAISTASIGWKAGKAPLKRLLAQSLPEELLSRPKAGFSMSLSGLLKDNHQALTAALLWYRQNLSGKFPAVDSVLEKNAQELARDFPHFLYALYTLYAYAAEHRLRV